jgi:hypothetical protein
MASVIRTVTSFTDFSGKRKDGIWVKGIMPQFDGSPMAAYNCAASSESVRDIVETARRASPGAPWPPNPALIRRESGDHVGGLRPTQTAQVSQRLYRIDSDIRIADTNILIAKLWARYASTLLVRYGPYADAGFSGSPGFRANHSFDVYGIRSLSDGDIQLLISDSLRDGRRAGIPEGAVWVNLKVIQQSLGGLDLGNGRTLVEQYGSHHGYFSFTITPYNPPPPPSQVVLRYGAHKVRPKRLRCLFARTIVRTTPQRIATNHAQIVPIGEKFDAYQRVDNKFGAWVGNKAGNRWVLRSGYKFIRYM